MLKVNTLRSTLNSEPYLSLRKILGSFAITLILFYCLYQFDTYYVEVRGYNSVTPTLKAGFTAALGLAIVYFGAGYIGVFGLKLSNKIKLRQISLYLTLINLVGLLFVFWVFYNTDSLYYAVNGEHLHTAVDLIGWLKQGQPEKSTNVTQLINLTLRRGYYG
jgi:hypothetical protein